MKFTPQQRIDIAIGGSACWLLSLFVRTRPLPRDPRRICVIKLWGIGDSILTLPMIAALHARFPAATIDVVMKRGNGAVFNNQPSVHRVIQLTDALRRIRAYDLCIDCEAQVNLSTLLSFILSGSRIGFTHGARGPLYTHTVRYNDRQHVVHTYLDLVASYGIDGHPTKLEPLPYGPEDERSVRSFLEQHGPAKYAVAIGAGCAGLVPEKMWPTEKFAALCDRLIEDGCTIIFLGGPQEQPVDHAIIGQMHRRTAVADAAGVLSLTSSFCLLDQVHMTISNDTGTMHMSAAQGTPTIGLFCPETPVRYAPFGDNNIAIYKPVCERPCINVHAYQTRCRDTTHRHMSRISVDDVFFAYRRLRKATKGARPAARRPHAVP